MLFPNTEVPLGKLLASVSSRGCLYAILVTPQNVEHNSITVNILYGQPAEHRNMPVDDAINLIAEDFQEKLKRDRPKDISNVAPIILPANVVAPPLKNHHPSVIQTLLNLLADNLPLTVLQYDHIIKYLSERRELQAKAELGEVAATIRPPLPEREIRPDPEIELQKKILGVMNMTSITDTKLTLVYPDVKSLPNDLATIELLKEEKVQNALNSLMETSLVQTITDFFKF